MSGNFGYDGSNRNVSKFVLCKKGCNQDVMFNQNIRSASGKLVPLNPDGTKHECPADPFHQRVARQQPSNYQQQETDDDLIIAVGKFVADTNSRLQDKEIVITVRDRAKGDDAQ